MLCSEFDELYYSDRICKGRDKTYCDRVSVWRHSRAGDKCCDDGDLEFNVILV